MKKILITTLLAGILSSNALAYYQAEQGRWLSRDSIGERGGVNVYAFALNDPCNVIDILGLTGTEGGNEPPSSVTGDVELSGTPTDVSSEGSLPYITPNISVEIIVANANDSAPITPPGGINIGSRPYYDLDAANPGAPCFMAVNCSATCKDQCLTWTTSWSTTAFGTTKCSRYDSVNGTWSGCTCSANASSTCAAEAAGACGGK